MDLSSRLEVPRPRAAPVFARTPGPTGKMRLRDELFEVVAGEAFFDGARVGTVGPNGDFHLWQGAVRRRGNVLTSIGAVWLGAAAWTPGSGLVRVGGRVFAAKDGKIYEAGEEIGWLTLGGQFRAVTRAGDFFEGWQGQSVVLLTRGLLSAPRGS